MVLAKLEAIVTEQLSTADDAIEDWNDIVPEDVAGLKQKLQSDNTMEERLSTADDAIEDWNDIVPEDVAGLKQKLQSDNTTEERL